MLKQKLQEKALKNIEKIFYCYSIGQVKKQKKNPVKKSWIIFFLLLLPQIFNKTSMA